jgi:alkaline phosphatase D
MMGAVQERWLERGLRSSRARWNIVANQVMVTETKGVQDGADTFGMDRWDGYPVAQQRLLRLLAATRRANPVVITGDVHSNWVADLKEDYKSGASPVVSTEFVGTSIASGGDGNDTPAPALALNPHLKFYNNRRGYVRISVTPSRWRADYRTVPYVSKPGAPIETAASWTVEPGNLVAVRT